MKVIQQKNGLWIVVKSTFLKAIHNDKVGVQFLDDLWIVVKSTFLKAIHNTLGGCISSILPVNSG